MRGLIVECTPIRGGQAGSVAHVRNVLAINKYLNWDIVFDDKTISNVILNKYDKIIFSYASGYMPFKKIDELLKNNESAQIYWIINEYDCPAPSFMQKRNDVKVIANFEIPKNRQRSYKFAKSWLMVNLNTLIWGECDIDVKKKHELIYYGTYRKDRAKYFKKYFDENIIVSSSSKNFKQYMQHGCQPKFIEKIKWDKNKETLRLFKYSLYIEDEFTHENYNHLANRFYEAVYCNCVPVFDSSCKKNVIKSGYNIPEFLFFDDKNQLWEFIKHSDYHQLREVFRNNVLSQIIAEREQTINKILSFIKND
ncbi:hypothetical protein [Gilliamella sp. ESL0250]|uniref:hypothetical protein n=1 Tax=Gilliamella sp. ESL0250 TaxID=2705036 RepID=UPI0015812233|nr:hypothetical protein [Gilliamella sp. ESL0250]NUF49510.1 hypothetical protein [Gilliamella sp. ESL0250]